MKLLLCAFEQLSGLKINFHKSEVFCYREAKDVTPRVMKSLIMVIIILIMHQTPWVNQILGKTKEIQIYFPI
jgi:hypothetical protein